MSEAHSEGMRKYWAKRPNHKRLAEETKRFHDRKRLDRSPFWQALGKSIPPPTAKSYPPSSWRMIERYAQLFALVPDRYR